MKITDLKTFFEKHNKVAVAFSGGVDSAYLLYAAIKNNAKVRAYFVKSQFQPEFELEDAKKIGQLLGADLKIIELDILSDKQIIRNTPDRCYYCKRRIFSAIKEAAVKDGFSVLIDGTNASDNDAERPGTKAKNELAVLSPLKICLLSKSDIRKYSKEAGLFTADKPAYSCLATRIKCGEEINAEKLEKTEKSEEYLFSLGFSDFRVRTDGDNARLEIRSDDFPLLCNNREKINEKLKNNYKTVTVNLEARK